MHGQLARMNQQTQPPNGTSLPPAIMTARHGRVLSGAIAGSSMPQACRQALALLGGLFDQVMIGDRRQHLRPVMQNLRRDFEANDRGGTSS